MRESFFTHYEKFVLNAARVVLPVLATLAVLVSLGALGWLAFSWILPTGSILQDTMVVPEYEPITTGWESQSSYNETTEGSNTKIPPVMTQTFETIDTLYQLVGRQEQKFSERDDLNQFFAQLVAPLETLDQTRNYETEFLLDLREFAQSMSTDELLKRITDAEIRTATIENSIFQFRDQYLHNLEKAIANAKEQSVTHRWNRRVTSSLMLQVISVCVTLFVVATMCLLGFHVALKQEQQATTESVSAATNEAT